MKLTQIQTLVAIGETGSIRAAARRLGLTQPALSKGLQALEEELGVPLVHRTARGVSLTPYGLTALKRGRGIALEVNRLREDIEQMRGASEGVVTLALSPSPALVLLPSVLRRFHADQPGILVRIREAVYPGTLQLLREGLADIAVGAHPPNRKSAAAEFTIEKLYENQLVVCCRPGHPKAAATSLQELLDCEWLLHGPAEGPGSLYAPAFQAHGLPVPRPWAHSESFIASLALLERTDALSLLPARMVAQLEQAGRLKALRLKESLPDWDVSITMRAQVPLTPAAARLLQLFRRTLPGA